MKVAEVIFLHLLLETCAAFSSTHVASDTSTDPLSLSLAVLTLTLGERRTGAQRA
jgi:hypothetical protein